MNKTTKRILIFTGLGLDIAAMVFLLVIAIIMLATMPQIIDPAHPEWVISKNGEFIGNLQLNPTLYFCTCVLPLILLFIANIVGVILYVKKHASKKAILADLSDAQKEALRAELLKEMNSKEEDKK